MRRRFIICLLVGGGLFLVLGGPSVEAQGEAVIYHDLSGMPRWALGNMQVKGAMGQAGSLAVAEMPPGKPGPAGNPHFHTQEQIVIGLTGSSVISIGGASYRLGSYGTVITPPDVSHFNINGSTGGSSTFIEFQPVQRRDWFPPYPNYVSPKKPTPVAVGPEQRIFEDFAPSSDGWRIETNGGRSKMLSGETVRFTMWDLSAANAVADLTSSRAREQFVYVLAGNAEIEVGSSRREMRAEMLAVVSAAAKNVLLRSVKKERTFIAIFE